ncbi:60S ribosomal protein L27a [Microtus ochrogaster]|uniref:60S ribosomal protein L27a n=1 Tax=Microtus ochrogaster TaxID=79684 RepID=A0A8J6GEK7_MICOH|nr:60S ribosomal protein L27a [Microtus ochrogaster]
MPSRLRKTQKLQGHVSHDSIGKHQKHPGGPGSAGVSITTGSTLTNITQGPDFATAIQSCDPLQILTVLFALLLVMFPNWMELPSVEMTPA